jgi:hypothetical protein
MGQFKPNSIGVCYLQQDSSDYYNLTISLPIQTLENQNFRPIQEFKMIIDSFIYKGEIILFDNNGEILRIENMDRFLLKFWCENDGGIQYRPTLQTKIRKANFNRPLKAVCEIQNICCFVLLNSKGQSYKSTNLPTTKNFVISGDYDNDGKTDCTIWTDIDEARNCDGEPQNDLEIILQIGEQNYQLRCCGP